MSDLQCPARFVVLSAPPDPSTAESLRHERVAAVYDGPPGGGATGLADALGLPVQVLARPFDVQAVLTRRRDALDELGDLADLHRGETVVVVAGGKPGQRVDVTVDGDGMTVEPVSPAAGT